MSSAAAVHVLMREIGPLFDLQAVTSDESMESWRVVVRSGTILDVEYDGGVNRIVITASIGRVAARARPAAYECLLRYNGAWAVTGGARMALTGEDHDLVMLLDLPACELDVTLLGQTLERMAGARDAWLEIIERMGQAPASSDAGA